MLNQIPIVKTIMHPREIAKVVQNGKDSLKLVSFDVFDTLLRRSIAPPGRSKVPAAKAIVNLLKKYGINVAVKEILILRRRIEQRLGKSYREVGKDWECPIDEVFVNLLKEFLSSKDAAEYAPQIVQTEIEAELSVIRPEKGMGDALAQLRKIGLPIVLVSDMYLSGTHVRLLLDKCHFTGLFDDLYVSSDYKLCKRTGRLYELILKI